MKSGVMLSIFTIFLWAIFNVSARFFGNIWNVQPLVFVSFTSLAAAVCMLIMAGKGKLAIETLKQPYTWFYSFLHVFMDILLVFLLVKISATEGCLMARLSIVTTSLLCSYSLNRSIKKCNYIGFLLIIIGFFIVVVNIPESVRLEAIIISLIMTISQSFRTFIVETHPTSNKATYWRDNFRVTGVIMLITGLFFIMSGIMLGIVKDFSGMNYAVFTYFPSLSDFLSKDSILAGIILGVCIEAISVYMYFQSAKKVGAETFLMIGALLPIFVYILEVILSKFEVLEVKEFNYVDLLAGLFIITGAGIGAMVNLLPKRKENIDMIILNKKAAMFGLDARIALAIFGALSVITGAVLFKAIGNAKATALLADFQEIGKAYEQYYLDTGVTIRFVDSGSCPEKCYGISQDLIIDPGISGWNGPYLPYKKATDASNLIYKNDQKLAIQKVHPLATGGYMPGCSVGEKCYLQIIIGMFDNNNYARLLDKIVDNGDGLKGRIAWGGSSGSCTAKGDPDAWCFTQTYIYTAIKNPSM